MRNGQETPEPLLVGSAATVDHFVYASVHCVRQ
jgi:hypothetical protein